MGLKKEILYRTIFSFVDKIRRNPRWAKKIVASALVLGMLFVVSFGFLLYFAVGIVKDLVAERPDLDLLAMERLIKEKSIVLSEEQQRLLAPIVEGLTVSGLAPEQASALKEQLFKTITPAQLAAITDWKATAADQAAGLFTLPPAVAAIIENYTGLSKEAIRTRLHAFRAWWQLTKPENSAEELNKTLQSL